MTAAADWDDAGTLLPNITGMRRVTGFCALQATSRVERLDSRRHVGGEIRLLSERLEEIRIIRNRERIESERNELRGHLRRHGPHRAGRSASCRREMRPQIEAGVFQLVQRQPPGRLLCSLQESRFCGR